MSTLKVPVNLKDHIQGNNQASITLVEYGDYECTDCGQAFEIIKQIQENYKEKLRFVFRHFFLQEVHPCAKVAAEIAEFAAKNARFWEMHDLIYKNQSHLGMPLLIELTKTFQLPIKELELALENGTFVSKIQKDCIGGTKSGITTTPAFFINGTRYNGNISLKDLSSSIETQLASLNET